MVILLGRPDQAPLEVVALGAWVAPLELAQAGVEELGFDGNDWHSAAVATAWPQGTLC